MSYNILVMLISATAVGIGYKYEITSVSVVGTAIFVVAWICSLRMQARQQAAERAEVKITDGQLRADLIACHELAIAKLGNADQKTRSMVIELLVEAGKHLGNPETNGNRVYSDSYFLNWNKDGIALVDHARALIVESQPRA